MSLNQDTWLSQNISLFKMIKTLFLFEKLPCSNLLKQHPKNRCKIVN